MRFGRTSSMALVLACALAGTACGQKGPLFLPAAPAAASAPAK